MASDAPDERSEPHRHTVLNVFGLTLEVSNPRLAELLTMDARDALATDVKDLLRPAPADAQDAPGAISDDFPVRVDARTEQQERARAKLHHRVRDVGERLGFETAPDRTWVSPTGISVVVREFAHSITLAAAAHYVREILAVVARSPDPDRTAALVVVCDHDAADVLKVAIRQARAYQTMRVARIEDLEELAALVDRGAVAHTHALAFIAPIAAIDVGELLAVLRCNTGAGDEKGMM
ncbi:MAG: hypothetical protein N3B11_04770 [Coriobacteriia bacterium]|nr:hypothetical protein [Coriobacteriia bacterium]